MSDLTQHHIQRLGTLRNDRVHFDTQWEEAAERVMPSHRDTFLSRQTGRIIQGEKKTELQFDATTSFAALRFSAVMESLVTPQSSIWHLLKSVDRGLAKNRSVKLFFDDLNQALFSYRYRPVANFVGNSQQLFLGLGVYGNGSLFIDQPDEGLGLRYRSVHLAETFFAENHAGIIDTVYRVFNMTSRQIMQKRGWAVPDSIQDKAKDPNQMDKKYEILHVVMPRKDRDPRRMDAKGKPFASLYFLVEQQALLSEGGFDSFPYAIARYTQAPGETYGRGPAQWVLPAIKVLNEEKRTVLKQGHRTVDPVLLAYDDGALSHFSMKAGALNAGGVSKEGKMLVHPLPTGNIAIGDKLMEMEKQIIHDAFLITLFQILVDTPQMTATEVLERAREKGMLLAPTAGRLQAEFLGPMIEREIDVLARQGLIPPMPPILQQAQSEYRIEYDSPMSRMQRAERATGFMRLTSVFGEYAKMTGDASPLDWLNFDAAAPELADINSVPPGWISSAEEVAGKREGRQAMAESQQLVDAAPAMASVAKQVMPAEQQAA